MRCNGPRIGRPPTSGQIAAAGARRSTIARRIAGIARIGPTETSGFDGAITIARLRVRTSRTPGDGRVAPQPKGLRDLRIYAMSRLMLRGWIDNLQTSWVKLGTELAQLSLAAGCNDFGGTLMEESISREAGADAGEYTSAEEIEALVRGIGRVPVQRTTLYGRVGEDGAAHADHGARGWRGRSPLPAGPLAAH